MLLRLAITRFLSLCAILGLLAGSLFAPAEAMSMAGAPSKAMSSHEMALSSHEMAMRADISAPMADMSHCPSQKKLPSGCMGKDCPMAMLCAAQFALPLAPVELGRLPLLVYMGQAFYGPLLLQAQMLDSPPARPPRT